MMVSTALCFSMVLHPQVQVHRSHAVSAMVSRHTPVLAQYDDYLAKRKADADDGESDGPVEYFFDPNDPANAEEDDTDAPAAEQVAEPAFDASSAAADAKSQASQAAKGALASIQGALAVAAAKAVSAVQEAAQEKLDEVQEAAQQKLDEVQAVPSQLASAAEDAVNQAVAEARAVSRAWSSSALPSPAPPQNAPCSCGWRGTPRGIGLASARPATAAGASSDLEPPPKSPLPPAPPSATTLCHRSALGPPRQEVRW